MIDTNESKKAEALWHTLRLSSGISLVLCPPDSRRGSQLLT